MASSTKLSPSILQFHSIDKDLQSIHSRISSPNFQLGSVTFDLINMRRNYTIEKLDIAIKEKSVRNECNLRLAIDDELVEYGMSEWDQTGLIVAIGSFRFDAKGHNLVSFVTRECGRNILGTDWIHFDGNLPRRARVLCVRE